MYETSDGSSRDIRNIDFLEKCLGLFTAPHFVQDFSKKYFLCHILLNDQILLSDCLYILRYLALCIL